MLATALSASIVGVDGVPVRVEVDVIHLPDQQHPNRKEHTEHHPHRRAALDIGHTGRMARTVIAVANIGIGGDLFLDPRIPQICVRCQTDRGRRRLLPVVALVVAAAALVVPERAVSVDERTLSFYHTHTDSRLDVVGVQTDLLGDKKAPDTAKKKEGEGEKKDEGGGKAGF